MNIPFARHIRNHYRALLAFAGVALVVYSAYSAWDWYYVMAPLRRSVDHEWRGSHNAAATWATEQEKYRRTGVMPDLCWVGDRIGFYGGKEEFYWLVNELQTTWGCGCSWTAIAHMANREFGSDPDALKTWAEQNRDLSQEEWLRDGFASFGVTVHLPPEPDDIEPLLTLLGRQRHSTLFAGDLKEGSTRIPSYIQYNAYRWLRDSGFDPFEYALSHDASKMPQVIQDGLKRYRQYEQSLPADERLGLLSFSTLEEDQRFYFAGSERINAPIYRYGMPAMIFGTLVVGLTLIVGAAILRRRHKRRTADATPHEPSQRDEISTPPPSPSH